MKRILQCLAVDENDHSFEIFIDKEIVNNAKDLADPSKENVSKTMIKKTQQR